MGNIIPTDGGISLNHLKRLALAWAHAEVDGVRIRIPFDMNTPEYGPSHYQWAKGNREQMTGYVAANCPVRTPWGIKEWMKGNNPTGIRVGIDCSGFAYRLLDEAARAIGVSGLLQTLGTDVYNTSAAMLSNFYDSRVASVVGRAQDVLPGDIVRCHGGGHVAVVIDVLTDGAGRVMEVWYAHSGFSGGPHISWIEVGDPYSDLGDPSNYWHEAAEDEPDLRDNLFRDSYYEHTVRTHYYRGDRTTTTKTPITVKVNGSPVAFPMDPFVRNGISFAMVRPLADAIGATIQWGSADESVRLDWNGRWMSVQIASTELANGAGVLQLPAPPELVLDRAVIPIRALSAGLGLSIHWQPSPPTVHVTA